jgi:hypothetical protein
MNTYRVYLRSRGLYTASFILYAFILIVVTALFPLDLLLDIPGGAFFLVFLFTETMVFIGSGYLAGLTARATVDVTLGENGLQLTFVHNFPLVPQRNRLVPYTTITAMEKITGTRYGSYIRLRFADGSHVKLRGGGFLAKKTENFGQLAEGLAVKLAQPQTTVEKMSAPGSAMTSVASAPNEAGSVHQTKYYSRTSALLAFLVIMCGIPVMTGMIDAGAGFLAAFGSFVLIFYGGFYLYRKVLCQKIEVTLLSDRIAIKYTRKPFYDNVQDRNILLADIASYKTDGYYYLTLYLVDGTKWKAALNRNDDTEEFEKMSDAVVAVINKENIEHNSIVQIKRKKTFYEGTGGLVVAIVLIILAAVLAIAILVLYKEREAKDIIYGIGAICSTLGYVAYIFNVRRKNKNAEPTGAKM